MIWLQFTAENMELAGRLLAAASLGALVGLERDLHGRSAGLRTHALVSLGAAIFTILSYFVAGALTYEGLPGVPQHDPGRIAAQVVTGIGFLGAGTILKSHFSVRGLTTASCLWLVAAIGMACGMGLYGLALASTGLALLFLVAVRQLERYLPRDRYHELCVQFRGREHVEAIRDLVLETGAAVLASSVSYDYEEGTTKVQFSLRLRDTKRARDVGTPILACLDAADLPLVRIDWDLVTG